MAQIEQDYTDKSLVLYQYRGEGGNKYKYVARFQKTFNLYSQSYTKTIFDSSKGTMFTGTAWGKILRPKLFLEPTFLSDMRKGKKLLRTQIKRFGNVRKSARFPTYKSQ